MPTPPLLDNTITISARGLVLGKSVSNFFLKKNIKTISIILDYKNNSLILWGDNPINAQPGDTWINGRLGFKLYPPGSIIYKSNTGELQSPRELALINIKKLKTYINFRNLAYLAKPLNNRAIIIENVSLEYVFEDMMRMYINMKDNFILLGDHRLAQDMKPESLIKSSSPNLYANVNTNANTSKVMPSNTSTGATFNTPNTNTNNINNSHNINRQRTQNNAATASTNVSRAHENTSIEAGIQTQTQSPQSQLQSQLQSHNIKKITNEEIENNSIYGRETPISEDAGKVDDEYKRMILGE